MPKSWWGKTLIWGYTAGYFIDVSAAAIHAWPQMAFTPWLSYVLAQSTYACIWPIVLVFSWTGLQW